MTRNVPAVSISWLVSILLAASVCMAQKIPSKPIPTEPEQEAQDQTVDKKIPDRTFSLGSQSIVENVLEGVQHHVGFTFAAYGAYTSNVYPTYQQGRGSAFTAFLPRLFVNLGKKKSQFHLNFGGGYRLYHRDRTLNSTDIYGNVRYMLRTSKRSTFNVTDRLSSSQNDAGSFIFTPIVISETAGSGSYYDVLFARQRITRNSFLAAFDYQPGTRHNLGLFGGVDTYRYELNPQGNANVIQAGGDYRLRLTKWLTLSNTYTAYLNKVDERFRDARIHRLEVGGLDFRLSHTWSFYASGGMEVSQYQGVNRIGPSATVSLRHTSRNAMVYVTYHKGYASVVGLSRVLNSDNVNARMGYRMTRWMLGTLTTAYYRSMEQSGSGLLQTLLGGAGIEFALRNDLVASVNYSYQNQQAQNFSTANLAVNRYIARVGLQYFWPSGR